MNKQITMRCSNCKKVFKTLITGNPESDIDIFGNPIKVEEKNNCPFCNSSNVCEISPQQD